MQAVDGIAPYREFMVKGHTEDWFDGEIMAKINNRDKLLKKYKKSKLEVHNKLSIHFGDDKTKSILFSGKNRPRDDRFGLVWFLFI